MTTEVPAAADTLVRGNAACRLYDHPNGEESLLLELPGDGSFSIAWTLRSAAAQLRSRGWSPGGGTVVDPRILALVAERLSSRRERPSAILDRLTRDMGSPPAP